MFKSIRSWLTLILVGSFTVLMIMGLGIFEHKPPIPKELLSASGEVLATEKSILDGQQAALNHQLQDYGTILGHGSYFGPDFTVSALNRIHESFVAQGLSPEDGQKEFSSNRYDPDSRNLVLSPAQTQAFLEYRDWLRLEAKTTFVNDGVHLKVEDTGLHDMAAYFFWTAWLSTAHRPGQNYSYTNNWPYFPEGDNLPSADSVLWSAISVAVLVLGVAVITLLYFRGKFYGEETHEPALRLEQLTPTLSQRKSFKYFVLAGLLFLVQALLGGYMAHAYVEPEGFYGLNLTEWLPFNLVRGLHLQLAIFWIALSFLGMGLYLAPIIGGKEPKNQGALVDTLFAAVVAVAVGSMVGSCLTVWGLMPAGHLLGSDGWEYMELGYGWRVLLFGGLLFWAFIVLRGIWPRLKAEADRMGLVHLFAYASVGMGLVYGTALLFNARSHVSIAEYWRWWVIHLWVEGTFEVFAVVTMGTLFVAMGLLKAASTARAVQFQMIILMGSGIIGTGHHLYFTGSPAWMIGLAACFSALEVVPLCLLCVEAWDQYRQLQEQEKDFAYKAVFWCLISVAIWNLFGAGVLGFLINQPIVSFYEMGTWLTAAHGHGALMGVYGFLSIAMMLFAQRGVLNLQETMWKPNSQAIVWLNAGLAMMVILVIVPVGAMQLGAVVEHGYEFARSRLFYSSSPIKEFLWFRVLPDAIFLWGIVRLNCSLLGTLFRMRTATEEEQELQADVSGRFTRA